MEGKIKEIYEKHGDLASFLAVRYLLDCGKANLCRRNIEREAEDILVTYPSDDNAPAPLLSRELKAEVLRCAAEFTDVDTFEILKHIQTGIKLHGIDVHPGHIVSFYDRNTGEFYTQLLLERELSTSEKDSLSDKVRSKVTANRRYHPMDAVKEALKEMGIRWNFLFPDQRIDL